MVMKNRGIDVMKKKKAVIWVPLFNHAVLRFDFPTLISPGPAEATPLTPPDPLHLSGVFMKALF